MNIDNKRVLDKLVKRHPDAREVVARWMKIVKLVHWKNLVDVKDTFNSTDYVKGFFIFNVGGNNYRILADVLFDDGSVTIIKAGTHAEYDDWRIGK